MSKILDRLADSGGILFLLLVGVGYAAFVAPFSPETLDVPADVVVFLDAHPLDSRFWIGMVMESVGLLMLVLFATRTAGRIRAASGPESWTPSAVVALAALSAAVKLGSFAPALVARLHTDRYDAGTVTALFDLNDAAYDLSWGLDGVFVLLLGLAALAARVMPKWLSLWAVAAGLAIEVGLLVPALFDTLQPLFLVWLLVSGVWALRHGPRPDGQVRSDVALAGQR